MYYKNNTEIDRLLDCLQQNYGLANGKNDLKRISELLGEKTSFSISRSSPERKKVSVGEIAKQLKPEFHNKTHFQAVLALIHKSSKTLQKQGDVSPVANEKRGNTNDFEDGMESYEETMRNADYTKNSNTIDNTKQSEFSKNSRSCSLPQIPYISFRNTSPLREQKALKNSDSVNNMREGTFSMLEEIARNNILKQNNTADTHYKPIIKMNDGMGNGAQSDRLPRIDRKIKFKLPNGSPPKTPTQVVNETEELGKKVLKVCNVFPYHKRLDVSPQLRKGEGRLVAGFGQSNKELYRNVYGMDIGEEE